MSIQPSTLRCPVCRAKFRGDPTCSRCGVDLLPLMRVAVKAWRIRMQSRQALLDGDIDAAFRLAAAASRLHRPPNSYSP